MSEDIESRIKDQAHQSIDNTLYGKPANDILNGRDSFTSVKPVRAIWELVQNARDVALNHSHIVFIRQDNQFVFKHDGVPFTNDTLNALILQTSSKSRLDGDQVGQYGTGFLATHKLGRVFHLAGSLKLVDDADLYCNFTDLVIDRSPDTREEMVVKLNDQFSAVAKLRDDKTIRSESPCQWTEFSYQQPHDIESKNTEEAFQQAPSLIPYVLALNEAVGSIEFQDEDGSKQFVRGEKCLKAEQDLSRLYSTPIEVHGERDTNVEILTLESKETVTTKKGIVLPKVTVILPVYETKVIQIPETVARLFIYLPLVGTEQWGVNFIIHAPLFSCATDDRSSLRLIRDGQTENDPAVKNREYIREATELVFEFISKHVREWTDIQYLAPVSFDVTSPNQELSDYYKELKGIWRSKMRALDLVGVKTENGVVFQKPEAIFVLDEALRKAVEDNDGLLSALYHVLCDMHPDLVPQKEQLAYWSTVFHKWYVNEECEQIVGIKSIVSHISENGMDAVTEEDLLSICQYLKTSGQIEFFDKNILLTEDGTLTNGTDGLKCGPFGPVKKACIKVLLPRDAGRFVKDSFASLLELPLYTDESLKTSMSQCTSDLQNRIKVVTDWTKTPGDNPQQPEGLLTEEEREALMNYCRLIVARDGEAFEKNVLDLIREYYDYSFDFVEVADAKALEWRGALRTLLFNVLTEFTLLPEEQKLEKKEWVMRIVGRVFAYNDFNDYLQNYRVYLSQSDEFRYCADLKKDSGIPEAMKDIYNEVFSENGPRVEVRNEFFASGFGEIAKTEAVWEVVMFGKSVMDRIQPAGSYLENIESSVYKDQIIDIINHFEGADGDIWKSAFPTIYNDVPALLAKLVLNKDNREPMIKIMKVKDPARLNKVAEIVDNENLYDIWKMGQDAWLSLKNEKADLEHKKQLGLYVEEFLLTELGKELKDSCQLSVGVDDIQGGQDIIISIDEKPVYFIEVKSRWVDKDSILMSAMQLDRSVDQKEHYSLFAVDMIDFERKNVKEHVYPDSMDDFVKRIKVVPKIGILNEEIKPAQRDPNKQVHIGGDYKAVVPQALIADIGIGYVQFMNEILIPFLKDRIAHLDQIQE